MKVALVTEQFDPRRGGAERSIRELAFALTEAGLDVTVLARTLASEDVANDALSFAVEHLPVHAPSRAGLFRAFSSVLRDYLAHHAHDIVHSTVPVAGAHVFGPRGGSVLHSARRHAQSYPCPIARTVKRATLGLNRARAARIRAERDLCLDPQGPHLAALSTYVADQFRRLYALPDDRIHVIPNGVDTARLTDPAAIDQARILRARFDPDANTTLLLFAAENFRLKGLHPLLHAAARVQPPPGRNFRILVVGTPDYSVYFSLAHRLGLIDRVAFLGPTTHVPALLHACDAVVLPTFNDAASRLVLEGFALAKPALTTRFNGAADYLTPARHGYVLDDPTDLAALANALTQLCRPDTLADLGANIERDDLPQHVSIHRHVRQLVALYGKLLALPTA